MDFEDCDFDEIGNLGDIFPDIEPYLNEVTQSFNEINDKRQKKDSLFENSDSDSGVGGDSFGRTGKLDLKNLSKETCSLERNRNPNLLEGYLNENTSSFVKFPRNYSRITPVRIIRTDVSSENGDSNKCPTIHLNENKNYYTAEPKIKHFKPSFERIDDGLLSQQSTYNELNSSNDSNHKSVFHSTHVFAPANDMSGIIDAQQVDRLIKRQERMIKNRQAASLSRQRKKEYMERLENKVEQQRVDNQILQNQIGDLRQRLSSLENDNMRLKTDVKFWRDRFHDLEKRKPQVPTLTLEKRRDTHDVLKHKILRTTATSTTILGLFLLLAFNFQIFDTKINIGRSMFSSSLKLSSENRKISHINRVLFSYSENDTESVKSGVNEIGVICNSSIPLNSTEKIRLNKELHSWSYRYKKEFKKIFNDRAKQEKLRQIKNDHIFYRRLFKDRTQDARKENNGLELYEMNKGYRYFYNVLHDIGRNPDTLYFVSLHSDNWIYPASNFDIKNTSTPKITLLLPAITVSGSKNKFMKIDCDVKNFTILNLHRRP